eukprot:Skav208800  [mRNA]  locus=scaffold478:165592:167694:+ [translate_table: standard]
MCGPRVGIGKKFVQDVCDLNLEACGAMPRDRPAITCVLGSFSAKDTGRVFAFDSLDLVSEEEIAGTSSESRTLESFTLPARPLNSSHSPLDSDGGLSWHFL